MCIEAHATMYWIIIACDTLDLSVKPPAPSQATKCPVIQQTVYKILSVQT